MIDHDCLPFSIKTITFNKSCFNIPIGSMYGIYGNIYHQYTPFMLAYIPAPWILWDIWLVMVVFPSLVEEASIREIGWPIQCPFSTFLAHISIGHICISFQRWIIRGIHSFIIQCSDLLQLETHDVSTLVEPYICWTNLAHFCWEKTHISAGQISRPFLVYQYIIILLSSPYSPLLTIKSPFS